ncbi:ArsR/SmtB family transcription factor [Spirochaeta cellobiosiphila]|uniref:ArsR/SmtB family transcription factor n=1 Tax=Spirochaeta cellobiosiphila TaxID=504483 RepID=UPI0004015B02|nr:helix-turn-helix domain-containing protein [Spirochaeta cellobiosiphila]
MSKQRLLVINPKQDSKALIALSSEVRLAIYDLLRNQSMNVREIADTLHIPASTAAFNVANMEEAGLIETYSQKATKGSQKICKALYDEILITFEIESEDTAQNTIDMEMPIGLYTDFNVSPPCGLCSAQNMIGYLDVPASFHEAERVKASLLWFQSGYVEYKFPNNSLYESRELEALEFTLELSSEVPGTNTNWPSDIYVSINNVEIGCWTSPGDFGDKRGKFTPDWWKLEGSQYGLLKTWSVAKSGSFIDGKQISNVCLKDLNIKDHHSIKLRIEVKDQAKHVGGVNIFGKSFGNYDRDIHLRLILEK